MNVYTPPAPRYAGWTTARAADRALAIVEALADDLREMDHLCREARDNPAGRHAEHCLERARILADRHGANVRDLEFALQDAGQ